MKKIEILASLITASLLSACPAEEQERSKPKPPDTFLASDPKPHIEINVDELTIDRHPIAMSSNIGDWTKVLGPYNRFDKEVCMFTWDDDGYVIVLEPINTLKDWAEMLPSDCGGTVQFKMVYDVTGTTEPIRAVILGGEKPHPFPKNTFPGTLIVNGLKVKQGMDKWDFQYTPFGPSFWVGEGYSIASIPHYSLRSRGKLKTGLSVIYKGPNQISNVIIDYGPEIISVDNSVLESDYRKMKSGEKVDLQEAKDRYREWKQTATHK